MAGNRSTHRSSYDDNARRYRDSRDAYFEHDDWEEQPRRRSGSSHASSGGRRPPDNHHHNGKPHKKRRMPGWQKAIIFLLVLASVLMAATVFVVWNKLGHIDRIGDEDRISANDEDFETDDDGRDNTLSDTAVNFSSGEVLSDQNVINILLIGRDARGSERGRSDSMIVLSLNRNTKQISMVSLMRDCYVQIPGYSNNKLNAAFSFGGYELLDQTIQKNFGIQIDYNVGVNFDGFEQVVDQLGGIDITLTSGEAEYMALWGFPYMTEGVNHMTGEQALCYARTRYVGTGKESNDFGRTYRQRMVLTTVYQEMMKKPLTEIWTILDSIMDCIETDMTNTQIISIGTEFYNMGISNLQSYRLPQDNGYSDEKINGMAVLVVDWDTARQNLQDWLYSDTPVATHDITASN